ncbi:uncharacterized protein LOC119459594 [Dermacentor silvarum]|uniref:uncharacterized protein LOC119459594 n=1 Tax=Dermacentor silvarum TaxID=543639 RepID=UPI0021016E23|nr:uncharacterized protein LOC119459594 [Dermacentor silvarum]
MALQQFILCFLFALSNGNVYSLEARNSQQKEGQKDFPIDKFMNTSKPLWVYNTTKSNSDICRVDVNQHMNATHTSFKRYSGSNSERGENDLVGKFSYYYETENNHTYDKMDVFDGTTKITEEVMEYLSNDSKCAVVSVMSQSGILEVWWDVRVEDHLVRPSVNVTNYEKCFQKFEVILNVTRKKWTSPYRKDYQIVQSEFDVLH